MIEFEYIAKGKGAVFEIQHTGNHSTTVNFSGEILVDYEKAKIGRTESDHNDRYQMLQALGINPRRKSSPIFLVIPLTIFAIYFKLIDSMIKSGGTQWPQFNLLILLTAALALAIWFVSKNPVP
ncbi:MAG: hypothetical protein ACE5DO_08475, partial [Desulfobacterales bacterium]